jgi:hypothetical protein
VASSRIDGDTASYIVQGWLTKGWSADLIRQGVDVVMGRRGEAPTSIRYFEKAIAEAHAERDRALPVVAVNSNPPVRLANGKSKWTPKT